MSEVLDYQAQHYLRQWINGLPYEERKQLCNIHMCNQHAGAMAGRDVYLVADDDGHAKYYGLMTCKNTWCCPVCTALMMEKYRSYIASAIEMLGPTHFGFGVTLTIPHYKFMDWRETTDIIYATWRYFRLHNMKERSHHVFTEFYKEIPTENWVRVGEYTWSEKNGAHPHFHCIWWTPRGKEKGVLDWESRLNDFWLKQAKRIAIKYWKRHKLHEDLLSQGKWKTYEDLADTVFYVNGRDDCWNEAFHFSRDKDGNLLEAKSSDYICGWGSDRELTGNIRKEASASGHYTPYQILQMGITNPKYRQVYLDFCLAVTRKPVHHRVNFSKNGLFKRIKEYRKNRPEESERLEKKSLNRWEVVCYFTQDDWYSVLDLEDMTGSPITSDILYLASQNKEVLLEYLDRLGLKYQIPTRIPYAMTNWVSEIA